MVTKADTQHLYGFTAFVTMTGVTIGNLLVATMMERSGFAASAHTMTDNGDAGNPWVKRVEVTTQQGDVSFRRSWTVWTKVATVDDEGAITVQSNITGTTTTNIGLKVEEFALGGGENQWVFDTSAVADTDTGSTSPLAVGPTGPAVGGTFFILGLGAWRISGADIHDSSGIAFTNSLSSLSVFNNANSNQVCIASAFKNDTAQSTYSTSISWNGTGHEGNGALLVFSTSPAGATRVVLPRRYLSHRGSLSRRHGQVFS